MRISIKIICTLALLLLSGTAARAQYEQTWLRTRAGFWGVAIDMDSHGNVYTTGASLNLPENGYRHDIYTIKYAPDGTQLWLREYNHNNGIQDDDPNWLRVDSQDNVLVLGTTHTNATGKVAVLLKYDPTGVLLWERVDGGLDYGASMDLDGLDNIYITGRTFGENWDFGVAKYDPDGSLLWSRTRSWGPGPDQPRSIAVDGAGNVAVVGRNYSAQIAMVAYDTNGNELWSDFLDDPNPAQSYAANHAVFDADGNLLVAGIKGQVGLVNMLLLKYAPDGTQLFERLYAVGSANRLRVDAAGNTIMTGQSWTTNDMLTIKVDAQGDPLWTAVHATPGSGLGRDLRILSDNGIVVAGSEASNLRWVLVKYDADGVEEWSHTAGPGGFSNYPRMMAVDANENIAVTGGSPIATAYFLAPAATSADLATSTIPSPALDVSPNPFRPRTEITYAVPRAGNVKLEIYDLAGRLAATLVDTQRPAGRYSARWSGRTASGASVASGVYLLRLSTGGDVRTKKITLVR